MTTAINNNKSRVTPCGACLQTRQAKETNSTVWEQVQRSGTETRALDSRVQINSHTCNNTIFGVVGCIYVIRIVSNLHTTYLPIFTYTPNVMHVRRIAVG